ncbi:MAG: AMP-binding protein [Acidimicrobiia bacterium]|nr:AMP-binding protein [Acidimicrobiia bacterium]
MPDIHPEWRIVDWLRTAADRRPDHPALVTSRRTVTYAELDRAADGVAAVVEAGVGATAVAVWGSSDPGTVAALWGIPRAGADCVVLPTGIPAAEAMRLTRFAGARGLWGGGEGPDVDRLLAVDPPDRVVAGPPDPAAAYVLFTSGSTGSRRGVRLTGAHLAASADASARRLGTTEEDRWLGVLPLGHVGGLSILWRQARAAATVVLHDGFDAREAAAALARDVSVASVVPTMLRRILDSRPGPYGGLRAVLVGGGPADAALVADARAAGIPALQTYGMTETASQICTEDPAGPGEPGTAGRPVPGAEVRIAGDRIEVRGPMVFDGYLGEPSREPGTWFRTGDRGEIDEDGRLRVLGRADRVVVSGGENVSATAVERALLGLPGVEAARVSGVEDPEWGSAVVAWVVAPGADADALRYYLLSVLEPAVVPMRIEVVGELRASWNDAG